MEGLQMNIQQFQGDCPDFDRVMLLNFCLPLIALESLPSRHCAPLSIFIQLCPQFFRLYWCRFRG
jgi:hypothetical protein